MTVGNKAAARDMGLDEIPTQLEQSRDMDCKLHMCGLNMK